VKRLVFEDGQLMLDGWPATSVTVQARAFFNDMGAPASQAQIHYDICRVMAGGVAKLWYEGVPEVSVITAKKGKR
jgi:hypothetical protein